MITISSRPLSQLWLKASVAGSIWASVEIILGSFLHNLRIPFSGTILSFIGVWLMIAFLQVWRENGLVWRAGLICALMKSISPSAIILGPMIGIFTEALLIELFIFLLGKNIAGYLVGGAFAVLSTITQKVVSLLIMYGFDLVKILADLYNYGVRQIGLEQLSPAHMLLLIMFIYMAAGIAGATGGYLTGKRYLRNRILPGESPDLRFQSASQLTHDQGHHNYSILFLFLNLAVIILLLALLNFNLYIAAGITGIAYVTFCFIHYRNSVKRLRKISFWITFLLITFAATILWKGVSEGTFFSWEGFFIGLKMNARAVIMITGFAAISAELKNPVIKSLLYHRGASSLYQSLNLAFSALPYIISNIRKRGNGKNGSLKLPSPALLSQAEELFGSFRMEDTRRQAVIIITGDVHQGKTTFAREIVEQLASENIRISGFLAIAQNNNGIRSGFRMLDIGMGVSLDLCSDNPDPGKTRTGKYYFEKSTIDHGLKILDPDNVKRSDMVVIDEIGPLEMRGQGWSSAVEKLCRTEGILQVWIVRKNLVNTAARKYNVGDVYVFDLSEDKKEQVTEKIKHLLRK